MAKNETMAAEIATKQAQEQARSGKLRQGLVRSAARAKKRGADYGVAGRLYSAAEDVSKIPALVGQTVMNPPGLLSAKETLKKVAPTLIGPEGVKALGRTNAPSQAPSVRAADIVAAQDAEMANVTPGQGGGRKGALLQSPLEQSGFRELVGPQPETGARTTYTDDKGSFLTSTGRAKGGGTFSVVTGPGSANFTPEEWKGMSAAQRSQANVDALKGMTEAVRGVTAQAREGRQGGRGTLVSAPSAFTQRKLMREYGMAVSSLKNDLRRGRVSSKKGRALAGVIQDYYGKALGKDPRELELAMAQEEGKTERTGLIDAGATERVGMEEEGEMERAKMPKPQTFSSQVIGEGPSGQKRYGLIGTGGGTKPIHDINLATMEQARAMVLEAKGDPELYQQRIAKFIEDFGQENWHD